MRRLVLSIGLAAALAFVLGTHPSQAKHPVREIPIYVYQVGDITQNGVEHYTTLGDSQVPANGGPSANALK